MINPVFSAFSAILNHTKILHPPMIHTIETKNVILSRYHSRPNAHSNRCAHAQGTSNFALYFLTLNSLCVARVSALINVGFVSTTLAV